MVEGKYGNKNIRFKKDLIIKYNIFKINKNKKLISILLLLIIVLNVCTPLAMNSKYIASEVGRNTNFESSFKGNNIESVNNKKDIIIASIDDFQEGESLNISQEEYIKNKIGFDDTSISNSSKDYQVYKYIIQTNEKYKGDIYISFNYEFKDSSEVSKNIQVNGESYALNDEILLNPGNNEIDIPGELYDSLNKLDVECSIKPIISITYENGYLKVIPQDIGINTSFNIKVHMPENLSINSEEINVDYSKKNNEINIENLNYDESLSLPLINSQEISSPQTISYEYTYGYNDKIYKDSGEVIVDVPVSKNEENETVKEQETKIVSEEEQLEKEQEEYDTKGMGSSKGEKAVCFGDYNFNDFIYAGEQSKVSNCEIDLGDNSTDALGSVKGGMSLLSRYVDLDQEFSIDFTLHNVDDRGINGWNFIITPVQNIAYFSSENLTAGVKGHKNSVYVATKYQDSSGFNDGINYGTTNATGDPIGNINENPFNFGPSNGFGDTCETSATVPCIDLPDLRYKLNYIPPTSSDGTGAALNFTVENIENDTDTFGESISGSISMKNLYAISGVEGLPGTTGEVHAALLEFTGAFEDNDTTAWKKNEIHVKLNRLNIGKSYPMYSESVAFNENIATGGSGNLVNGSVDYLYETTNTSEGYNYDEIINKTTNLQDANGNPINPDVFLGNSIPSLVNETVTHGTTYSQEVSLPIADVDDFLSDKTLILPTEIVINDTGSAYFDTGTSATSTFNINLNTSTIIGDKSYSLSVPTHTKTIDVGSDIEGNTQIDNNNELVNLFGIQIVDGYLTEAMQNEDAITVSQASENLINSDRFEVITLATFPISTEVEGSYNFTFKYTTVQGEVLSADVILNILKKDGITPDEDEKDAKNIAYGTNQDGSVDNGVSIIGSNRTDFYGIDYKVDALSHEIIVRIELSKDLQVDSTDDTEIFSMEVKDDALIPHTIIIDENNHVGDSFPGSFEKIGEDLSNASEPHYIYEIKTGSLESTIDSGANFKRDGEYSITLKDDTDEVEYIDVEGNIQTQINIAVPKTLLYDNGTTDVDDDILYSLIGDSVNVNTDVSKVSSSDISNPYTTGNKYGIYELESIGYEETNGEDVDSDTATSNETDWSEEDLTLAKYDHIIRPIDGNYLVASNIDASETSTNQEEDKLGGFGTDGYRPIGQKIGTIDGKDSEVFTGSISGNIDIINSASDDNTYISNMYINEPTLSNIGMISKTRLSSINNLGIINPIIKGYNNVGSISGSITNSELLNVYAMESIDDSASLVMEITGNNNVGGLVGTSSDVTIYSDNTFESGIPGTILSSDIQPNSTYPDYDGYKTFNTLDVKGNNKVGGVVGNLNTGTIDRLYNKGSIESSGAVGGIVGNMIISKIMNVYNAGNIISSTNISGGIVGISNNTEGVSEVRNVYNTGYIFGDIGAGGILGDIYDLNLYNAINIGEVEQGMGGPVNSFAGGIVGNAIEAVDNKILVKNTLNGGKVSDSNTPDKVGGIVGNGSDASGADVQIENALNVGKIQATATYGSISNQGSVILTNTYALSGVNDITSDVNNGAGEFSYITSSKLQEASWWKEELFKNVAADYENFNIEENEAIATISTSDDSMCVTNGNDESCDNDLGQVNRKYYPHIKEMNADGSIGDEEIPEQINMDLPTPDYEVSYDNYKINAITFDIYLLLKVDMKMEASKGKINVYEGDFSTTALPATVDYPIEYDVELGEQIVTIPGTSPSYKIEADQDYTISILSLIDSSEVERLVIHTPKQVKQDFDTNSDGTVESDVIFAEVGDNTNTNTFISSTTTTDTTNSKPTGSTVNADGMYGVYELESICYEESNNDSATLNPANWSESDLTLYKYDHIIRPCNGNYIMTNSIDGSQVDEGTDSSLYKLDREGGWASDSNSDGDDLVNNADVNDGFRTIGHKETNTGYTEFTGSFIGENANSFISGLYISQPTWDYTGVFSYLGEGGIISGIGVENTVDGSQYTGGMVAYNRGHIINSYSTGDITGKFYVGGLTGRNYKGLLGNSYTTGNITGQNYVGGIVGYNYLGELDNDYAGGNIIGKNMGGPPANTGGIAGYNSDGIIKNSYATGDVIGEENVGGAVGYNYTKASLVNSYATGDVIGEENVGGLVGKNGSVITNSYGYQNQTLKEAGVEIDTNTNVVGNEPSYTSVATYANLIDSGWYLTMLGWESSNSKSGISIGDSINVGGESGKNWTAPWGQYYGEDTGLDDGIIDDNTTKEYCMPHIMNDVTLDGIVTNNDGSYVPNQPCIEIIKPIEPGIPGSVDDFKIDAQSLTIYLHTSGASGSHNVTVTNGSNNATASISVSSDMMELTTTDFPITANSDIRIQIPDFGTDFTIHTPVQIVMDYDFDEDGSYSAEESDVSFVAIGDGVNQETDVTGTFTSSKIGPDTVTSSTIDNSKAAYGIYELESIGYEDANYVQWDTNDLTLAKYDHIIRPVSGSYVIADDIDALAIKEPEGALKLDREGGWSTDSDANGSADTNDGFSPIGREIGDDRGYEAFQGVFTAINDSIIQDMYIDLEGYDYVSMIASASSPVSITNINMTSTQDRVDIYGSAISGNVAHIASMIGYANDSFGYDETSFHFSNNSSGLDLQGGVDLDDLYIGGLVGQSYSKTTLKNCLFTGSVDLEDNITADGVYMGGIAAYNSGGIEDSSTTGSIIIDKNLTTTGTLRVGNIAGSTGRLSKNCYTEGIINIEPASSGTVLDLDSISISGLIGTANGIINSYYNGTINVESVIITERISIGGIAAYNSGEMHDVYSTGEINLKFSGASKSINIGGLVGDYQMSGTGEEDGINRAYTTTNITISGPTTAGYVHVGGGIGQVYEGKIENMFAAGTITWPEYTSYSSNLDSEVSPNLRFDVAIDGIGGLIGAIGGGSSNVIRNVYSYEGQTINGEYVTSNNIIGTEDIFGAYTHIVSYGDLINSTWYTQTTEGSGINLDSVTDLNNSPGYVWNASYKEEAKMCYPHLYNDIGVKGGVDNDGTYIPGQTCQEILPKGSKEGTMERINQNIQSNGNTSDENVNVSQMQRDLRNRQSILSESDEQDELNLNKDNSEDNMISL